MVIIFINIRVEEHHHSVKDIKKHTHSAEDVEECHSINKMVHVQHVDIQLLDLEDVQYFIYNL
jgi:hypothetical protein